MTCTSTDAHVPIAKQATQHNAHNNNTKKNGFNWIDPHVWHATHRAHYYMFANTTRSVALNVRAVGRPTRPHIFGRLVRYARTEFI